VANRRLNFCHHVSKWLVSQFDLIAFEKLNIRSMTEGFMAKSIMSAAWAILLWQISYKVESTGRYAIAVNPRGTTKRCSACGVESEKTLAERVHTCPNCGLVLHRDVNAAKNILLLARPPGKGGVSLATPRVLATHF
jgi:putative transposase